MFETPEKSEKATAREGCSPFEKSITDMRIRVMKKETELIRSGKEVILSTTHRENGKENTFFIVRESIGYSVLSNGKAIIFNRSLEPCAKEAFIHGIISERQYRSILGKTIEKKTANSTGKRPAPARR